MTGTLETVPSVRTQTQTLSQRKSVVTTEPSSTIIASTEGFSLSIVASATVPCTPTSSGHEFLPTHRPKKKKKIIIDQRQYNTDVTGIYSQLLIHVHVLYLRNWSLFPFCFTLALLLSVFQYVMYCYGEEMWYI